MQIFVRRGREWAGTGGAHFGAYASRRIHAQLVDHKGRNTSFASLRMLIEMHVIV